MTARSWASQNSYVLGEHNWTISGDNYKCSKNKDYEIELKLTGCNATAFTCNNGQCIHIGKRCDHLPQCEDESDEQNCKLLVLQHGYDKKVPPLIAYDVKTGPKDHLLPVMVNLTLQRVVAIEEDDYSISFKFMIKLIWREKRATYQNLNNKAAHNMLTQEEVHQLWLPRLIYWNTNQQETTRLGDSWEWTTDVSVQKEGKSKMNSIDDVDEAEIFHGSENSLRMEQTYTHAFQCVFKLFKYPFDTQVVLSAFGHPHLLCSYAQYAADYYSYFVLKCKKI